ncbi:MAG: hypothetical protein HYX43_15875 [Burkholderiales bacterium]|nr:hypothetical protein [Burkholderiales bacterium]
MIARLDARDIWKGDQIHPNFSVVATPGEGGEPFALVPFSTIARFTSSAPNHSFLMSKPSDRMDLGRGAVVSYTVLSVEGAEKTIEVTYSDDDKSVWSRYRATRSNVVPISSRMFHPGYMFGAFPFALGFALLLYAVGRFLRSRLSRARSAPGSGDLKSRP